jgi:hypothetical protein
MHTFLLGLNKRIGPISVILDRACGITKRVLPSLGLDLKIQKRVIPEVNGGWFYMVPGGENKKTLMSEFITDRAAILVFGEIFGCDGANAAEAVFEAWKGEDLDEVRLLDGCFSAVLIDRGLGTVDIVSDLLGHRSLRYFDSGEALFVSSHDVPIIATGLCPVEFDLATACSIICYDWSLGGKSLVQGIQVCNPNEYVRWTQNDLKKVVHPLIKADARIPTRDRRALARQIDLMVETMIENTRKFVKDEPVIYMDLTAGLDTRAVLGLVLSMIDESHLTTFTAGGGNSFEVRTASRLARMYGFGHQQDTPALSDCDSFLGHCRLRAFLMNGDTDGKRAVDRLPRYDDTPRISGNGAEIFRGYYYPVSYGKQPLLKLTMEDVVKVLEKKIAAKKHLAWISNQLVKSVRMRLIDIINAYCNISQIGSDMLDLFYVFERYGRWGSMVPRFSWEPRRFSPFNSTALLKLGFELPPPIADDLRLQKTIIRRYLPAAYYLPINGSALLPFLGCSFPKPFISKWFGRIVFYSHRFLDVFRPGGNGKTNDQIRAERFVEVLGEGLRDVLIEDGSIGMRIFQKEGLQRIIDDHISMKRDNLQVIGHLAVMEAYRHLIMQTEDLGR